MVLLLSLDWYIWEKLTREVGLKFRKSRTRKDRQKVPQIQPLSWKAGAQQGDVVSETRHMPL